jgi:hypothetical protein
MTWLVASNAEWLITFSRGPFIYLSFAWLLIFEDRWNYRFWLCSLSIFLFLIPSHHARMLCRCPSGIGMWCSMCRMMFCSCTIIIDTRTRIPVSWMLVLCGGSDCHYISEGLEKAIRGGWMEANQNSLSELGLYPRINTKPLSSNLPKTD